MAEVLHSGKGEVQKTVIRKKSKNTKKIEKSFFAYVKRRLLIFQMCIPEFQQKTHKKTSNWKSEITFHDLLVTLVSAKLV